MNPGLYHGRPEMNYLPTNFRYAESLVSASQPSYRILSRDGPPRMQPNQQFRNSWPSNILPDNYNIATPIPVSPSPTEWTGAAQLSINFDDQSPNDYYEYSTDASENDGDGGALRGLNYADVPRSWPLLYDPRILNDNDATNKAYELSAYMIEANKHGSQDTSVLGSGLRYDAKESSRDFARLSISRSPRMENGTVCTLGPFFNNSTVLRMPSSEASDDNRNNSREVTVIDGDEPYAKLIYRALMSAPNHSMVLQEIYQWFRENTTKGSSDTKGWMNSIRHNLSMNAAFKKTERKISGDETKKSTEWVLEDFAVKDGVQSTTRYRKGTGIKKFTKSENSAAVRQGSGRNGGIYRCKSKLHRQKGTEDRNDPRRSIKRVDTGRRSLFQSQNRVQVSQRQVSPLTPNPEIMPSISPFFSKNERLENPYEDICSLEDVQGVFLDGSPLFRNVHDTHCHQSNSMLASQLY